MTTPITSLAIVVRQAAQRAGLRVPADRRVDPADGDRLRLRRRRPRGRAEGLHRAHRHGASAWAPSGCSAPVSSSGRPPRRRSRSSASSPSRSGRSSCSSSGPRWAASTATATASPARSGSESPEVLAYLNPFIAQADVLCGTETNFGSGWCGGVAALVPTDDGVVFTGEAVPGGPGPGGPGGLAGRRRRREGCGGGPVWPTPWRRPGPAIRAGPRPDLAAGGGDVADPLGDLPDLVRAARLADAPLALATTASRIRHRRMTIRRPFGRPGHPLPETAAVIPPDPRVVLSGRTGPGDRRPAWRARPASTAPVAAPHRPTRLDRPRHDRDRRGRPVDRGSACAARVDSAHRRCHPARGRTGPGGRAGRGPDRPWARRRLRSMRKARSAIGSRARWSSRSRSRPSATAAVAEGDPDTAGDLDESVQTDRFVLYIYFVVLRAALH